MIKNLNIESNRERITVMTLKEMKELKEKVAMLSIYDFPFAQLAEKAGLDIIIVGDSLGMTVLGYQNTLPVTMDEMINRAAAARRGSENIFIVGDMPFLSYQASDDEAVRNAGRFIKEAGCEAVKCEASKKLMSRVRAIANAEILVMGHIGLNPHKIHEMGGYRIQGKSIESTWELLETALELQEAGVFAILLEGITEEVGGLMRDNLKIPVYGIGSGRFVDGQLLIGHDPLGLYFGFKKIPKYIKQYFPKGSGDRTVGEMILEVFETYIKEVKSGAYPSFEYVHNLEPKDWRKIKGVLKNKKINGKRIVLR